jgi:hypothetical protein
MGRYSKLWGGMSGYVVGILFTVFAVQGWATCTDPAIVSTCTVAGVDAAMASRVIEALFTAFGIWVAPKNAA